MLQNCIINRLTGYVFKLYDNMKVDAIYQDNVDDQAILATEVEDALHHMKKGKAPGPEEDIDLV